MPTSRAFTVLLAAFVLYLFANQTQVGWLYVMSALLAGVVLSAALLSRRSLHGIRAERSVPSGDAHEGDEATITLTLRHPNASAYHVRVMETCSIAAPDSLYSRFQMFIPVLPRGRAVEYGYTVVLDRRGLHEFAPLVLTSRAPFGFFGRQRTLDVPTRVLVLPEVLPLARLSLLDNQLAPQVTRQTAGIGNEVLGVRLFRPGDSPRHIHWRSVARTGQLMSREFADESQPGVTLVIDLFRHAFTPTTSKHTPFEWAVKAAASIGEYARRRHYPLHLLADTDVLPAPGGAAEWSALLQYLARVQPTGQQSLAHVLRSQPTQAMVAVMLPYPDASIVTSLLELQHRGTALLVVLSDPDSFPDGGESAQVLANRLSGAGVPVRVLRFGHDLASQLADPVKGGSSGS